jgi:hypothetical protein
MAVSDDGSTLWVSRGGECTLQKYDLTRRPPVLEATFTQPEPLSGGIPATVGSLLVLPGTTASVVASLHTGLEPNCASVVVFDDGVARPKNTEYYFNCGAYLGEGPPGFVFGLDEFGRYFVTLRIDAEGVTQTETEGLQSELDAEMCDADGRVFTETGGVIDVTEPESPVPAGELGCGGLVRYDEERDEVVMLSCPREPGDEYIFYHDCYPILRRFAPDSLEQLDVQPLGASPFNKIGNFVRVSSERFAAIAYPSFEAREHGEAGLYLIHATPASGR